MKTKIIELITDLTDPDDCILDHHGHCQAHGWTEDRECPHKRAKSIIKEIFINKNSNMEGDITISKKLYLKLQIDSERLTRLEAGGIDNWDWYGESLNPDDEPNMNEFKEKEKIRIAAL